MEPSSSYSEIPPLARSSGANISSSNLSLLFLPFGVNDSQVDLEGHRYKLLDPTVEEVGKITHLFNQRPPQGYEIASIQRVYAPDRITAFSIETERLQRKFDSKLDNKFAGSKDDREDEDKKLRQSVWELFQKTARPFHSKEYPSVHLLPLWHGTRETSVGSIFEQGYCRYNPADPGYFGKGFYFTEEAAYASLYSRDGVLLLNWVATCFSYPVIQKDFKAFIGGACYENYDSHFIPVVPFEPLKSDGKVYHALSTGQTYCYKEFVVFQTAAALPRYVVKIRRIAIKSFYPRNALFHLFQLLHYRKPQSITPEESRKISPEEDIKESWKSLLASRSYSSSSSSSSDDCMDRLISSRNIFEKILLNLFPIYNPQSIEPDLDMLLAKITEEYSSELSRRLIERALTLFYQSSLVDLMRESSSLDLKVLFETIDEVNWLVLFPLQFKFPLSREIDLVKSAFEACFWEIRKEANPEVFKPLMRHLATALAKLSDVNEVLKYYNLLFPYPQLRKEFFKKLEALNWPHLSLMFEIPDITGFRFSFERDEVDLRNDLLSLMDGQPQLAKDLPQVKMLFFSGGEKHEGYLDARVIEQLKIDREGNIHKFYKDASHSVAQIKLDTIDLHFKQCPINPWMEYAVHSLMYRVAGRLTPPNQLVRVEVVINDRLKVYPVNISRTIPGTTLKDLNGLDNWDQLNDEQKAHWTWLCLCSLLTHPGDGRNSNYIVDSKRHIFCVDNDIAFVEPVTSGITGKVIHFGAAPFCYFTETILHPATLEQFSNLDAQAILDAWVEGLLKNEEANGDSENRALFSQDEMNHFEKDYIYKKHLLLREGTLAKLNLQFLRLQEFIKKTLPNKKEGIPALDFLNQLVTLRRDVNFQSTVGGYVHQEYRESFKQKQHNRLNWVLGRTASQTQKDADKAHYGAVITREKVISAKEYRLQRAREELYISLRGKSSNFKNLEPERQLELLKGLTLAFQQNKPLSITLNHCSKLDRNFLKLLLHPNLVVLDLSYCPKVDTACLRVIQESCPKLQELNITGCTSIRALASQTLLTWESLEFSTLEVLKAVDCPNLSVVRLKLPLLKILDLRNNPMLEEFALDSPRVNTDSPDVDLRNSSKLPQLVQLAYKKTALEILRNDGRLLRNVDVLLTMDEEVVRVAVANDASSFNFAYENLRIQWRFNCSLLEENTDLFQHVHEHLKTDRQFVIFLVEQYPLAIKYIEEIYKKDPDIVLKAVSQNGLLLKYAEEGLRQVPNTGLVLTAVRQNGLALEFAHEDLKKNKEVVLAAVRQNGNAFQFAHPSLRQNEDLVLEVVALDGKALLFASQDLKRNERVVLAAVRQNGNAFQFADHTLRQKKSLVMNAVFECQFAFNYVDSRLKTDVAFVVDLVFQNPHLLELLDESFKKDLHTVLTAVCQEPLTLKYADDCLKKNRQIALEAVSRNINAFEYVDQTLKGDKDFLLKLIYRNRSVIRFIDDDWKKDKRFFLEAIANDEYVFEVIDEAFKKDFDFMLEAVLIRGFNLKYADKKLRNNKKLVLVAVSKDGTALKHASDNLREDKSVVLAAVGQDAKALQFTHPDLQDDDEVVLIAVSEIGCALQFASKRLRQNEEVVLAAAIDDANAVQYGLISLEQKERIFSKVDNLRRENLLH